MLAWRLALPLLKRAVPLPTLARIMRTGMRPRPEREEKAIELASWLYGTTALSEGESCLERSLLLYRYLSQISTQTRLLVGFRRREREVEGHAWVAIGDRLLGAYPDDLGAFAPVLAFGPKDGPEGVPHGR